jgi:hypothetical protein
MTTFHTKLVNSQIGLLKIDAWQPVLPPSQGGQGEAQRAAFHVYMLLPGFSLAFHAATLHRSRSSISNYRADAAEAAYIDPKLHDAVYAAVQRIRPEHGLDMARLRVESQLPHWSRLAICYYRKLGMKRRQIAVTFNCSYATVANVLQGKGSAFNPLSGVRSLTSTQLNPPGRW